MKAESTHAPREEASIFAAGLVKGVTEEIELRPQLAGRVVELLVSEGELVKTGQALLRVDDEQYRYELESAAALADRAKSELDRLVNGARSEEKEEAKALMRARLADLEKATLDFNRSEQLWEQSAITDQQLDDKRTKRASARAVVEAAKARVQLLTAPPREDELAMARAKWAESKAQRALADTQLKRTRLIAPRQGLVLKVGVEQGELVGPESRLPAIIMTDVSRLRVQAFVEELDAPRLNLGMLADDHRRRIARKILYRPRDPFKSTYAT